MAQKNSESNLEEARFIMQRGQKIMIIEKEWKWDISACRHYMSVNGCRLNVLLDLSSSESFINKKVTLKFQIETKSLNKEISLAQ